MTRVLAVLLLTGCGSGLVNSGTHIPEIGRYDCQLQAGPQHLSADLVIKTANDKQLTFTLYFDGGGVSSGGAVYVAATGWPMAMVIASVTAIATMTRDGNNYHCTASVLGQANATCSITHEGPDSARTAPR